MIERKECVLCESSNLREIYRINNLPVFMGVVENYIDDVKVNDLIIDECCECGNIQNKELIDLDLVYMNNHNTTVVGDIWINHYKELNKFIKNNSIGDVILEIGDPSAKLATDLRFFYKKWIIVEPNPNIGSFENIEIIKDFFTKDFKTDENIKTIVHSHVLEHMYEPLSFLKDSFDILEDGGCIIFSIPNIKWLLENKALPTGILHFEHTYYIDVDNVEYFLNKCGFKLDTLEYYKNHSIFIKAIKDVDITSTTIIKNDISIKFLDIVSYYKFKIESIKDKLADSKYYLYSAHINSQYLLNNGLYIDNIICLLDNSNSKIGKKLYGYNLEIKHPSSIENDYAPIVVVSHMGAYIDEIKTNLLKINKKISFL
jgi:predicted SAM-dependent methyltransferase